MKILVLHRIPYQKIDYHRGLDHDIHDVYYLGDANALSNIPASLRCQKIERRAASVEACLEALQRVGQTHFDRIVSLSEYELMLAAALRERLGTPGPNTDDVALVRDKVRMKTAVEAAGLVVPRNARASAMLDVAGARAWVGRTVLKPTDGASSEGVQVFHSMDEAIEALRAIPADCRDRWELEEFVDGAILHFDGLVADGSLVAMIASRYVGTCLGYARGAPLGSVQIPLDGILEPMGVGAWVERCLEAVSVRNGSFHLEAFATPRGLVFLEVGARVGGADVVACFELATGLHLPSAELALMSGLPPPMVKQPTRHFGWFVYPGHVAAQADSREVRVQGTEAFRCDPRVITWHERSVTVSSTARISYQALEAPLAGTIGSESHLDLDNFLTSLFESCRLFVDCEPTV